MTFIAQRLSEIRRSLPDNVKLVAVSKYHPLETLQEAYDAGQRCFGESRVQELQVKHDFLPKDIEWHFIGHLQTNKVRYIVPYVSLIHSVDSERLLQVIEKQAARIERTVDCLLEVHVAREDSKYGFTPEECSDFLSRYAPEECPHVRICGIMGMASHTDDDVQVAAEFATLKELFDRLRAGSMGACAYFSVLSMGMSHDYRIAVGQGSTLVRIGTDIFGERQV